MCQPCRWTQGALKNFSVRIFFLSELKDEFSSGSGAILRHIYLIKEITMVQFFGRISLTLAAVALAASLAVPAQAAEVKTKYFSIDLPADWIQPQPVQEAQGSLVALFANSKDGSAVTITVVANPMSAKDVAAQTVANMKSGGMSPSDPVEKDGLYETSFSQGPGKGMSWFGSNGKEFAVTTVLGSSLDSGRALLKGLKPVDASLFPKL